MLKVWDDFRDSDTITPLFLSWHTDYCCWYAPREKNAANYIHIAKPALHLRSKKQFHFLLISSTQYLFMKPICEILWLNKIQYESSLSIEIRKVSDSMRLRIQEERLFWSGSDLHPFQKLMPGNMNHFNQIKRKLSSRRKLGEKFVVNFSKEMNQHGRK